MIRFACILIAVLLAAPDRLSAQGYPDRPVKVIVPFSAGSGGDTVARVVAEELRRSLGGTFVVDNRPGASGQIGTEVAAKSPADGYTLLVSFTSHTINATLYPKLPFDPIADFTPISMIARTPNLLVGNPKLPANDLKDLIALAKQKPGALTMAIGGIGSSLHMAGEQFKAMAGVNMLNVPYKGTAPATADVIAGHVDLMFTSLVTGAAQVRAGKLRAYGVTTADRQASFPDLPAIGEIVPKFESSAWFGLFGPANLPMPIATKLNAVVVAALNSPRLRGQLETEGATPVGNSLADFSAFVRADVERWAPIVKQSGATPE